MANLSFNYFWITTLPNKPKILLLYRAPWHKGWAGHTSSNVKSELLLVIEYTTYMIVTCTQSPLMSLLESWNWCFFLSPWMLKIFEEDIWFRLPNRSVASFILSFLVSDQIQNLYKIDSPPQTKMTSKDDNEWLVSLKFLRPWQYYTDGSCLAHY